MNINMCSGSPNHSFKFKLINLFGSFLASAKLSSVFTYLSRYDFKHASICHFCFIWFIVSLSMFLSTLHVQAMRLSLQFISCIYRTIYVCSALFNSSFMFHFLIVSLLMFLLSLLRISLSLSLFLSLFLSLCLFLSLHSFVCTC